MKSLMVFVVLVTNKKLVENAARSLTQFVKTELKRCLICCCDYFRGKNIDFRFSHINNLFLFVGEICSHTNSGPVGVTLGVTRILGNLEFMDADPSKTLAERSKNFRVSIKFRFPLKFCKRWVFPDFPLKLCKRK